MLTRWNADEVPSLHNLVLLMPNEGAKLAAMPNRSHLSRETVERINQRLEWARLVSAEGYSCYGYKAQGSVVLSKLSETDRAADGSIKLLETGAKVCPTEKSMILYYTGITLATVYALVRLSVNRVMYIGS